MATVKQQIQNLTDIFSEAIENDNVDTVPARQVEDVSIFVKTGTYRETLPIIVPESTVILGDELRSSNAGPSSGVTDRSDAFYSQNSMNHLSSIVRSIVVGDTVTPSVGNTEVQSQKFPFADTPQQSDLKLLIQTIQNNIDFRIGTTNMAEYNFPVGYNDTFLPTFGNARKLLSYNKEFLKAEVVAYIKNNFPNILYSKTKCAQDVGYIVDAIVYDMTYGGNTQSIIAGLAYYDGNSSNLAIDSTEKSATISAYNFLKSRIETVITGFFLPSPQQSDVTQFTDTAGNSTSINYAKDLVDIIISILQNGVSAAPNVTVVTITGADTLNTSVAHGLEVGDSFTPRATINGLVKNKKHWIVDVPTATSFKVSESFGGSILSLTNGSNLNLIGDVIDYPVTTNGITTTTALITAAETLDAAQEQIIRNVIDDLNKVAYNFDFTVDDVNLTNDDFQIYVGKDDYAHTYVSGGTVTKSNGTVLNVSNFVYNEATGYATITTSVDHELEAGDIVDIQEITVEVTLNGQPITFEFPSPTSIDGSQTKVLYRRSKCERDTRLILEAVMFDFMLNSNFQSLKSGYAYLRATSSEVYGLDQKQITRDALDNARTEALANVGGDSTAQSRITPLMELIDAIIFSGSIEGTNNATVLRNNDYAIHQLEMNKDFIVQELTSYIQSEYSDTVNLLQDSTSYISISDTSWLNRGASIRFTGDVRSTIEKNKIYYVQNIIDEYNFTISETRYSNIPFVFDVNDDEILDAELATNFRVELVYNTASCERDVSAYLAALKYDLKYPGNYKSLYAARYYGNSVIGSLEEDMYYVRNGTGIRNQTLEGLSGDVLAVNEFGTSRVSAGAFVSLDPGWGPDDDRTWVKTRSCYVQGVTTFGYAAVGQKIDGALHNGGNDSIVSNDFTQVISDGIGAWVTNNGRAELVSVFTYYARIGYLSENGGRIRGTNGNCSYGTFGAVAEGFDATETPIEAVVDNRQGFDAVIGSVSTDGDKILGFEFDHAGNEYTEVEYIITGGGVNSDVENDEFRDDAVFEIRGLDLGNDSSGQFGGDGYLTNANTAQGGTTTKISLAAVDQEVSSAYIGMKVVLDGGKGAGQFGIVTTYDSGTKEATVVRESDGQPGWDHFVPGTPIVAPDPSTTYVMEPAISLSSPGFLSSEVTMSQSGVWSESVYGNTSEEYLDKAVDSYEGNGTGASFNITRVGTKYFVTLEDAGEGYARLDTLTILGSSLNGDDVTNDIVITLTSVNSTTGAILEFDFEGSAFGGRFVAVTTSNNNGSYSNDGETWQAMTLPTAANGYSSVAHGLLDDGSSLVKFSKFVAVSPNSDIAAYSSDGITWTASTLPISANWTSVAFGNGRFVAVASDSTTVAVSNDGEVWDLTSTLSRTGANEVAYGMGRWVVVFDNSSSGDGVNYSATALGNWNAPDNADEQMPTGANWTSVTWGQGAWVAVASDTNTGAISIDGINWNSMTVGSPDSTDPAGYNKVRYGQGLFMATLEDTTAGITGYSYIAKSEDGLFWEFEGVNDNGNAVNGYNAISFGNPNSTGFWSIIENQTTTRGVRIRTGATARARAFVSETKIFQIRILEPGSGYESPPSITITDPNNIFEAPFDVRIGKGALATPSFVNRGEEYGSANAEVESDLSNGFADFFQNGNFVFVKRLTERPVPGANVVFDSLPDQVFRLVNVVTFLGQNDGAYTAFLQISPEIPISQAPPQNDGVTTRIRYSQVRLTNHDFLDIGTGNFVTTNYPNTPLQEPDPSKETTDANGGRVFFTSTDQDGNFRVGDLFTIEQSTGVATLNADAFNIAGLQELSLGEVTLGGGSASIDEFSTDPFFTADSDSIVPTQRAIKAYIAAQIGGGGASLNVNSVTAGSIFINTNQIRTTDQSTIQMRGKFDFQAEINGYPLAWNYFLN